MSAPPPPPPPPPIKKSKFRDNNSDYRQMYRQFKTSRTHAIANNVLNTKKFAVPEGYKLVHSKKGIPYLVPLRDQSQPLQPKKKVLSVCAHISEIEEQYGLSIRLYFEFLYMIVVLNLVLFAIQLVNYIWYLVVDWQNIKTRVVTFSSVTSIFFTSNYPPSLIWVWRITNGVAVIISLLFGPFYYILIVLQFARKKLMDHETAIANKSEDVIQDNVKITWAQYLGRIFLSYLICAFCLILQLGIVGGLTIAQNYTLVSSRIYAEIDKIKVPYIDQWRVLLFSLIVSALINISISIFKSISQKLTAFEKHSRWTYYRTHETFKVVMFQLLSMNVMAFFKGFFTAPCIIDVLGNQFLVQLLLDLLVLNFLEIVVPYIVYCVRSICTDKKKLESIKPDFSISDEYLEIIYRQFIIYLAMASFPMITLLGVIISFLEIFIDRIKLLRLCNRPPMMIGSFKSTVAFLSFVAALLAVLNYGGGSAYILGGRYWCQGDTSQCSLCTVFQNECGVTSNTTMSHCLIHLF